MTEADRSHHQERREYIINTSAPEAREIEIHAAYLGVTPVQFIIDAAREKMEQRWKRDVEDMAEEQGRSVENILPDTHKPSINELSVRDN